MQDRRRLVVGGGLLKFSVSMTLEEVERLDVIAKAQGISRSAVLRQVADIGLPLRERQLVVDGDAA